MAWTGSATQTLLGKHVVRITGLSLAGAGDTGTIGLPGGKVTAGGINLPADFPTAVESGLTFADLIEVRIHPGANAKNGGCSIAKAGTTLAAFEVTVKNEDGVSGEPNMEIYVEYRHSLAR